MSEIQYSDSELRPFQDEFYIYNKGSKKEALLRKVFFFLKKSKNSLKWSYKMKRKHAKRNKMLITSSTSCQNATID